MVREVLPVPEPVEGGGVPPDLPEFAGEGGDDGWAEGAGESVALGVGYGLGVEGWEGGCHLICDGVVDA